MTTANRPLLEHAIDNHWPEGGRFGVKASGKKHFFTSDRAITEIDGLSQIETQDMINAAHMHWKLKAQLSSEPSAGGDSCMECLLKARSWLSAAQEMEGE